MRKSTPCFLFVALIASAAAEAQVEPNLYWQGGRDILRASPPGYAAEILLPGLSAPVGLALHLSTGKLYWKEGFAGEIRRSGLDGSQIETVVSELYTGGEIPVDLGMLALDAADGKLYWGTVESGGSTTRIQRSNVDGSSIEDLVTGLSGPAPPAIAVACDQLYWSHGGWIRRSNEDGLGTIEDVVPVAASSIAVDCAGGKLHWTTGDQVERADLDGTNVENLATCSADACRGIRLDPSAGKMYWGDVDYDTGGIEIRRADLDGSNEEPVTSAENFSAAVAMALDPSSAELYLGTYGAIRKVGVDGSGAEVVIDGVAGPRAGIESDSEGGWIYWIDFLGLRRTDLEGDQPEILAVEAAYEEFSGPLKLDLDNGYVYWLVADFATPPTTRRIRRAALDGSGPVDVCVGLPNSTGAFEVDPDGGRVFWTQLSAIAEAALATCDGVQTLVDVDYPRRLALDLAGGKIYWSAGGGSPFSVPVSIGRVDLDGMNPEVIVDLPSAPPTRSLTPALALDPFEARVYWSETPLSGVGGAIRSAELDGTGPTDVVTGLLAPTAMSLPEPRLSILAASGFGLLVALAARRARRRG